MSRGTFIDNIHLSVSYDALYLRDVELCIQNTTIRYKTLLEILRFAFMNQAAHVLVRIVANHFAVLQTEEITLICTILKSFLT